ncbi:hypothetical protein [Amycolatopsis aidingensis]|uniref:hypothetical protein n=1 Tax=Amycolatopsis aidingensis TaxID=2842453 RepID=UPI001C0DB864|nr:hypothetical protein [Amycolatopsis aidingensis]
MLTTGSRHRPTPAPLVLSRGDVIAVVGDPDSGDLPAALRAVARDTGVALIDVPPESAATGHPVWRVDLVVAAHHSVVAPACHLALATGTPVLLPGCLSTTTAPLRLWLRPEPTLEFRDDRQSEPVLHHLHLTGALELPSAEPEDPVSEVLARPSSGGMLLGVTDGQGGIARWHHGAQSLRALAPLGVTIDDNTRVLAPGHYWIAPASPPLYRLHAEPFPTGVAGHRA